MKQWTLALAIAGTLGGLVGCSSDAQTPSQVASAAAAVSGQAPARGGAQDGAERVAPTAAGDNAAGTAAPEEKSSGTDPLEAIEISDAAIKQIAGATKSERLWEITASIRNGSKVALPGVELVADLTKKGEEQAFARNSAEVRFDVPLQPGDAFKWRSLSPVLGKNPPDEATVAVKATRWLEAPVADENAWKPLDPATATPKTVGEPITVPVEQKTASRD